ncbi:MAG: LysR substrate-binding domain-containing protein [Pseudomonadota bacterium]
MKKLDSDLLWTFIAVAEAGSITDGAARICRSQSAASTQINRLESVLGRPVFERHGRGVELTEAGRNLLPVARSVTAQLEGVVRDISSDGLQGRLRLGLPDHGRATLTGIVAAFARLHPKVELNVVAGISTSYPGALSKGQLDLAVYETETVLDGEELLLDEPTHWAASPHRDFSNLEPLPVALFDHTCWWREAAINSLKRTGRPYRVVYSSQSVAGIQAALEAGIAVSLLGRSSITDGLTVLDKSFGFGKTSTSKLVLATSGIKLTEGVQAMASAIRSAYAQ